ncbi:MULTISPECIES: peptide deformylase [unclassified Gilliamella]|uniref:peptide deformylase n=1 Tax=unclassified Gilliamella TaxID=2685620 RepID=UPI002269B247|nr:MULTISPECIES: peptide deformylase [unclassified Gilliamella]MCX8575111.1 peptide deformylase [Gilliamella sp. B3831]MCX8577493.1 peptide deformylase [Gilliamella sp. B3815]MCX8579673.1 peptide deformylase [Gilliamella sp. B2717]MCX8588390.1 peptide deformylase [Gilliamella sp. B3801]MCX8590763.1 peptide deformylase [Gilliamella sp. B3812]
MAILPVLRFPDERLRKVAKPVTAFTPELQTIIDNMIETMYEHNGIGLAATQVNVHEQIIVIDVTEDRSNVYVIINPEVISQEGETGIEEGCLSIPDCRGFVPRAEKIKIKALDRNGNPYQIDADELLAICIQHEMDHLKGKLFVDYLSPLKRQRIEQKMKKMAREELKSR